MKICVIAPTVIPVVGSKQLYGGIELVISLAVDELVARGHDVYLFASGDSETKAHLVPVVQKAIGIGESFIKEHQANKRAYKEAIAARPDLIWDHTLALHSQEMLKRFDSASSPAKISINEDIMLETNDIPIVHTLHGPAKDHLPDIVSSLASLGHYFITISHDQAKRYYTFMKRQHLGTVYNAIDIQQYRVSKSPSKFYNPNRYVFWIGRYSPEKGAHIALHAAHKAGFPIRLMGMQNEVYEKEYFQKMIQPYVKKNDKIYPPLGIQEKSKLFRNAYVTLMTNLWHEPFGLVSIESMASGTAVIAPDKGALPELLGKTGIIIQTNDLKIYETDTLITPDQEQYIERVAKHIKDARKKKPEILRERVENLFSVKQLADGYEEAFAKAIYFKMIS